MSCNYKFDNKTEQTGLSSFRLDDNGGKVEKVDQIIIGKPVQCDDFLES